MHRLDPLIKPASIAVVGASNREASLGTWVVENLLFSRFSGRVHYVNPRLPTLHGKPCFAHLAEVPEAVDLAILHAGSDRILEAMQAAIAARAKSVLIFDPCVRAGDTEGRLAASLRALSEEARVPVCGGSSMGVYNFEFPMYASFYPLRKRPQSGSVALISQSGSALIALVHRHARIGFNLAVAVGQELGASVGEYIDYALDQPTTKVVALFVEGFRDVPALHRAALRARRSGIPIVMCKVARDQSIAHATLSHSGAMAGSDAALAAFCRKHGIVRAANLDELGAIALVLACAGRIGAGSLGAVVDSGGLRLLMYDRARELSVRLSEFSILSQDSLKQIIPAGQIAMNPVDAGGTIGEQYEPTLRRALEIVLNDEHTAIGWWECDASDSFNSAPSVVASLPAIVERAGKPLVFVNSVSFADNEKLAVDLSAKNIPVINGLDLALRTVKLVMDYRDAGIAGDDPPHCAFDSLSVNAWMRQLRESRILQENAALRILKEAGLPVIDSEQVISLEECTETARKIGLPVVLKTAAEGILHKSDVGGVRLRLNSMREVEEAYRELSGKFGREVVVQRTAPAGLELAFGALHDPQFGPIVVVSAGGVLIEQFDDRIFLLPPFNESTASMALNELKVARLFAGVRGQDATDISAVASALSRFSVWVNSVGSELSDVDLNPVICSSAGCAIVDALIVGR